MATTNIVKHVCDKCGNYVEKDIAQGWYPQNWQHMTLFQTGVSLDLCDECNVQLVTFMEQDGATNMKAALINERNVI